MISLSDMVRTAGTIAGASAAEYWSAQLKDRFGLSVNADAGCQDSHLLYRQLYHILLPIPTALVRHCGIDDVLFRSDMGPNKPYFPNHGYYSCNSRLVAMNADCFWHPDQPDDFFDYRGYFLSRAQQTVVHEFGHGYDAHQGDLSVMPSWTSLSGWSEEPKSGLVRIKIQDPGAPEVIGEWYYNPKAEFTRFYGKRNPWDDWADCFSFYMAGVKDKVPATKRRYFDALLGGY